LKNKPLIIGVTGAFGSGKSTAADFFESRGFKKIILSSFLEEETVKRGFKKITRKILQDIGNEWRKKYGAGILARKAIALLKKEEVEKAVIDGIRNVGEIDEFRKHNRFPLLATIADRKVRFDRLAKLKRRESLTWELFTKLDRRDLGLGQKSTGLQVAACQALADVFIENNSDIEEFKNKLEKFLKMKKNIIIAIDGPVGSGKGTLALLLAKKLKALYVYTGGMYRALALNCLKNKIDIKKEEDVLKLLKNTSIDLKPEQSDTKVYLNNKEVSSEIFLPSVSSITPIIAAYPRIRKEMVARQKKLVEEQTSIIEGRDIASVVAPNADLKIYLTAQLNTRIKRRLDQLHTRGIKATFDGVKKEIEERDRRDFDRDTSPLMVVKDAVVIDTTFDTVEDTFAKVLEELKKRGLYGL